MGPHVLGGACLPRPILAGSVPVPLSGPPAPMPLSGFAPHDLSGENVIRRHLAKALLSGGRGAGLTLPPRPLKPPPSTPESVR